MVIAATERELAFVREPDGGIVVLACGIGPVEAAVATAAALSKRRPDALLHVGIAGARGIDPPALVIGSESVYEDTDSRLVNSRGQPRARVAPPAPRAPPHAPRPPNGNKPRRGGARQRPREAV